MDKVKGDPIRSLPSSYAYRNRLVRARFDALEEQFQAEVPKVVRQAVDSGARTGILDDFTKSCVQQVVKTIRALLSELE